MLLGPILDRLPATRSGGSSGEVRPFPSLTSHWALVVRAKVYCSFGRGRRPGTCHVTHCIFSSPCKFPLTGEFLGLLLCGC